MPSLNSQLLRWRTVIVAVIAIAVALAGLWMVAPAGRAGAYSSFMVGLGAILATVASKSAVEHLSNGSGVRGAVAALMTDAKPGEGK